MCPMHGRRRFLIQRALPLLILAFWTCRAVGQTTQPAGPLPPSELPDDVRTALAGCEDLSFAFAQPGFYALLEHLKTTENSPGYLSLPIQIDDWRVLLERPTDFRGLPVTIEGVVGRNKAWRFQQDQHRHLGTVWQLELWRPDQPIAATLILTDDATDIPLGVTIRVTAYFVMVRQYYSETKRLRQAALLLGHGPTLVSQAIARPPRRSSWKGIGGLVIALTAAMLAAWIVMRRSVAHARHARQPPRAAKPAPFSLADDLAAWVAQEAEQPSDDAAKADAASDKLEDVDEAERAEPS